MASDEPDDYQTISDNCSGYMVLISEGIVCTRCRGEKLHKANDCRKAATAADLATDHVPGADLEGDGMDNADSGVESLSDTDSVSSESTARSDGSDMQMTDALQSDQGGSHSQDTHLPKHDFARPAARHTSIQPDRTSASPPNLRTREPNQVHRISSEAGAPIRQTKPPSHHDRDVMNGPNTPVLAETYSNPRSGTTIPTQLPSKVKNSTRNPSDKSRKRSHPHGAIQHANDYEAPGDRLSPKSLVDTMGKFDYGNTTCPSSFGFGRLPSEAMG